ncbi:short-chain dehydrogenase/oxidoreductase [Penicillium cosmopolitanum]|uniref:Short-chain dehydrogenase/oxidoreductase n=1 Tax=Penicillium cosmopolitanum TaxID=1131564 RepID=A0A9W9W6Z8_9EURO|nr:short-chain dehydrogenase/oxidoreductase [Penicillium cosmopolitanum]KAJ5404604.1 short-chain dehydrogenase/oxidoreductase [Penicillium cosmopolitanum]
MSFPYQKVLLIGATSGIGEALATRLVENGTKVIISGRRKENLDKFVEKHGEDKVTAKTLDVMNIGQIAKFASEVVVEHPDLDCIFVNSGIQRAFDFSNPDMVDMDVFDQELTTNYTSAVRLAKAFIPHLQQQSTKTALIFTTSQMALVPMMRCPNYGASKAALHHFILALRTQLSDGPGDVQTELHDAKHQPDLKNGHLIGMPLQQFTEEVWEKLVGREDQILVGSAKDIFNVFEVKRQELYQQMTEMLSGLLKQFLR